MSASDRRARREARKAERRGRRSSRKEARGGTGYERRTSRKAARADKKQLRRDSRMQARQQRVEARKAKGLAKIAAKSESGYWSPEGIAARQETLGGIVEMGGDLLGGILGGGSEEQLWDDAGYSDAAAFESAYPDEYEAEMGELIELPEPEEEMEVPWAWVAVAGGAGLVGVYMYSRRQKR